MPEVRNASQSPRIKPDSPDTTGSATVCGLGKLAEQDKNKGQREAGKAIEESGRLLVVSFSIKRQIALVRMQQCGRSSGVLSERLGIATYFWGFEYITSPLCISVSLSPL